MKAVSLLSSKMILEMNSVSIENYGIHQVVVRAAVTDMFISCAVSSVVVCLTQITQRGQK